MLTQPCLEQANAVIALLGGVAKLLGSGVKLRFTPRIGLVEFGGSRELGLESLDLGVAAV